MEGDNEEADLKYKCGECTETDFNLNSMIAHCVDKHSSGHANGSISIEIEAVSVHTASRDVFNLKSDGGKVKDVLKDASDDGNITFIDVLKDVSGDNIVAFIDIIDDISNDSNVKDDVINGVSDNVKGKAKGATNDLPDKNVIKDFSNDSYLTSKNVLKNENVNSVSNDHKVKIKNIIKQTSNNAKDKVKGVIKYASNDIICDDITDHFSELENGSEGYKIKVNDILSDVPLINYVDEIFPKSTVADANYFSYVSPMKRFSYDVNGVDDLLDNPDTYNGNYTESTPSLLNVGYTNYVTNTEATNDFSNVDYATDNDSKTNVIDILYVNDFTNLSGNFVSATDPLAENYVNDTAVPSKVNQDNHTEHKSTFLCNVNDITSLFENPDVSHGGYSGFNQNILYDIIDTDPTSEISNASYVTKKQSTPGFSDKNYVNHVIPKQSLFVENLNVASTKPDSNDSKIKSAHGALDGSYVYNTIGGQGSYVHNTEAIPDKTGEFFINESANPGSYIGSTQDIIHTGYVSNTIGYPGSYVHVIPDASIESYVNKTNGYTKTSQVNNAAVIPDRNVHSKELNPDISDESYVNKSTTNAGSSVHKMESIPNVSSESYIDKTTVKTSIYNESYGQNVWQKQGYHGNKTSFNHGNNIRENLGVIDDHNIRVFNGSKLIYEIPNDFDSTSKRDALTVYMGSELILEVSKSFIDGKFRNKIIAGSKEITYPEPQIEKANPRTNKSYGLLCDTAQKISDYKSAPITFETSQEKVSSERRGSTEFISNLKSQKNVVAPKETPNRKTIAQLLHETRKELSKEEPKSIEKLEPNQTSPSKSSDLGKSSSSQLLIKQCIEQIQNGGKIMKDTYSKSSDKSYKCDVCDASFSTALFFSTHKEPVFSEKPYKCDVCDITFGSWCLLNVHKRSLVNCAVCGKSFQSTYCSNAATKMETRSNTIVKMKNPFHDFPTVCAGCEISFKAKRHISSNIQMKEKCIHNGNYKCQYCEKEFIKKYNLDGHVADVHQITQKPPFKCDFCDESFLKHSKLRKHLSSQHGLKPYKCDICGISVTKSTQLKWHKQLHTGEKPFKCDHCGKKFSRKSTLTEHIRSHTKEKPYKCDTCDKSFRLTGDLWRHKKIHTGERQYFCEICGKGFTLKNYLNMHMRTHTGERRFECHICKKRFVQSGALKSHLHGHTGEKCHVCHLCGRSFIHRSSLLHHLKNHDNMKD